MVYKADMEIIAARQVPINVPGYHHACQQNTNIIQTRSEM
jgi:hypothetical protein